MINAKEVGSNALAGIFCFWTHCGKPSKRRSKVLMPWRAFFVFGLTLVRPCLLTG